LIPIISPEMRIPFVEKFDFDVSGRYDDYSDFGSTANPKFGATWQVVTGIKLRGDIASSFVAPPLTAIGQNGIAINNSIGTFLGPFSVPLALYPQAKQIPGCTTATTVCTFNTTAVQGVVIQGGNSNLKAQIGHTWTVGADFAPPVVPGLTASFTYWHNQFLGGVTSPLPALALGSASFGKLLTIYPNGATAAQLTALSAGNRQTSVFPQNVYWAYNFLGQNALNLTVEGIDGNVQYGHSFDWGRASGGVSFTYLTRFDQNVGGPTFSVLNTSGYNSTFPSIQFQARGNLGATVGPVSLTGFLNYTGAFRYWGSTAINPVVTNAQGVPVSGGDKVKAYETVDLHASYDLSSIAPKPMQGAQVYVDVTNLFDTNPPFENAQVTTNNSSAVGGYDPFEGNPIGRVVTVGVKAKF
jgi:iron complex outermembrane receptor protein